jgi:transposase
VEHLFHCLEQSARAYGFPSGRWTQARVAVLIQQKFGVDFCAFHVGRILASHGWRLQKSEYKVQTPNSVAQ